MRRAVAVEGRGGAQSCAAILVNSRRGSRGQVLAAPTALVLRRMAVSELGVHALALDQNVPAFDCVYRLLCILCGVETNECHSWREKMGLEGAELTFGCY